MEEKDKREAHKYLPDKRPDEQVHFVLRRHWMAVTSHFLLLVIEGIIPIGFFVYFNVVEGYEFAVDDIITVLAVLFASGYYLFIWLFFFHHWIDYYLDVWVVTDQRIVNVIQSGLFSRTISELNIMQVQDVTSQVKGSMATFMDYGHVHIQTAGEKPRFIFEQIPNPRQIAIGIVKLHNAAVKQHPEYQASQIAGGDHLAGSKQEPAKKEPPGIISSHRDEDK